MHWTLIAFLAFAVCWLILGIFVSLVLRRMPGPARFVVRLIFGFITLGVFMGARHFVERTILIKGPDDAGAIRHVGERFWPSTQATYHVISYKVDADGAGSGTYHISYTHDTHRGVIYCHYNAAAERFDHDEVKEYP